MGAPGPLRRGPPLLLLTAGFGSGPRIARVVEGFDHHFLVARLADVDRRAGRPVPFGVVVRGVVMGARLELAPRAVRVAMLDAQREFSGPAEIHDDLLSRRCYSGVVLMSRPRLLIAW